jgi:hypothetical protein
MATAACGGSLPSGEDVRFNTRRQDASQFSTESNVSYPIIISSGDIVGFVSVAAAVRVEDRNGADASCAPTKIVAAPIASTPKKIKF